MFERVAPSEEQKDAEAAEGRSPDKIASLKLAAILYVVNALDTVAVSIVLRVPVPIIMLGISLGLAYYLYKLRPRAEALALGLTVLGAIAQVVALFTRESTSVAALEAIPALGTTGAFFLLLVGEPRRRRRILALVLYGVLSVGFYVLAIIGRGSTA